MEVALSFYRDRFGLTVSEEVTWQGHRCVFLRAGTEHHSVGLYPKVLREDLGLSTNSSCMAFGMQVAEYAQLRDAVAFMKKNDVTIKFLPPELFLASTIRHSRSIRKVTRSKSITIWSK